MTSINNYTQFEQEDFLSGSVLPTKNTRGSRTRVIKLIAAICVISAVFCIANTFSGSGEQAQAPVLEENEPSHKYWCRNTSGYRRPTSGTGGPKWWKKISGESPNLKQNEASHYLGCHQRSQPRRASPARYWKKVADEKIDLNVSESKPIQVPVKP